MLHTDEVITDEMLESAAIHHAAEMALGAFIKDLGDLKGHTLLVTLPKNVTDGMREHIRNRLLTVMPPDCHAIIVANDVTVEKVEDALDRLKRGDRYRP